MNNSQTEGIVFSGAGRGFISAEQFSILPARLSKFETKQWTSSSMTTTDNILQQSDFQAFPNPTNDLLTVSSDFIMNKIELSDEMGKLIFSKEKEVFETQISTSNLPKGIYFLRVISKGKTGIKKIVKN